MGKTGNTRVHRRLGGLAFDIREDDADLEEASGHLARALEAVPEDPFALAYAWSVLQRLDWAEDAKRVAERLLEQLTDDDATRPLVCALARGKMRASALLTRAGREAEGGGPG